MTQEPSRILVVDDEENLRNILEFQLRGEGFAVRGLGRGDETLPLALQWKPDVVLLDLMMPGMDGFSVCRALRANESTQGLPIIVITARGDAATRVQTLVAGTHEFIVKPYSWDDLLRRIRKVIELSRSHHGVASFIGLPGSAATEAHIARLFHGTEEFAFCSLDIDHFHHFNETFGYDRGDEVLRLLGRLLSEAVDATTAAVKFVGHLGGDEFVVLTSSAAARPVAEAVIARFDTESRAFFPSRDVERGHYEIVNRLGRREMVPLLALTVAVVDRVKERDLRLRKLADVVAELRTYGKSRTGSLVVSERQTPVQH